MRRATRWASLVSALVLATTCLAHADDRATRDAHARFREGLARVKAGDFEAARLSFKQAYAVLHKRDILWNLALAEQKSGHPLDALAHFKQLQREAATAADRASSGSHVAELMSITGHVEILAEPGAQVSVDGAPGGTAPLAEAVDVLPGKHRVEARTPQGASQARETEAGAGQVVKVTFARAEPAPPPPVAPAPAPAPAPVAAAPPPVPPPPPAAPAPDAAPATSGGTFWDARGITVATAGGLAVVAGGLGLGFGLASSSDASKATTLRQNNPGCAGFATAGCQDLQSTTQAQHTAYVTSEGMWIASGVLAAGAVGAFFLWPRSGASASSGLLVAPSVGPGAAGATVAGRF